MKQIVFGEQKYASSKILFSYPDISENSNEYWVYELLFGYTAIIQKSTEVGKQLEIFINDGVEYSIIQDFLNEYVLKDISLKEIREYIDQISESRFNDGRKYQAQCIKQALYL